MYVRPDPSIINCKVRQRIIAVCGRLPDYFQRLRQLRSVGSDFQTSDRVQKLLIDLTTIDTSLELIKLLPFGH